MKPDLKQIKAFASEGYGRGVFNESLFRKDFNNVLTTKRMISRFLNSGKLNERLLINNMIKTLNVFGVKKTNLLFRMLLDDVQFSVSKAILMFLRQYDFEVGDEVYPNRIIVDVLRDISTRYNLDHI